MSATRTNGQPQRRPATDPTLTAQLLPDADGRPARLSVRVHHGAAWRRVRLDGGAGYAVLDSAGRLLRVEVRGRVRLSQLARIARAEALAVRRFLQEAVPPRLVNFV
jgi:hypothetical protein